MMRAVVIAVVLAVGVGGWRLVGRFGASDVAGVPTRAGTGAQSDLNPGNVSTTSDGADGPFGYEDDRAEADAAIAVLESAVADPEGAIAAESIEAAGGTDGLLPEGATLAADPGSWRRSGDVAEVIVDVSLPDGTVDRFVAVMLRSDDGWKVVYTVRGEAP